MPAELGVGIGPGLMTCINNRFEYLTIHYLFIPTGNMATAAEEIGKQAAQEIGKSIVVSLKREINYFCCFNNNVGSFTEQVQKLEDDRKEVLEKVDASLRNAKRIVPKVDNWLKQANVFQGKIAEIKADIPYQKGCLNMLSRFSFSKKTKKTAEAIEKLRDEIKHFENALPSGLDALPPAVDLPPLRHETFPSRKQIEDAIVKALRVPEFNIVGIGGMGGVGKTTMADNIRHRMKKENFVDETVKVVVSQPINILKIQGDIAEQIGNSELKGVESLHVRAQKLRISLTRGKKILIILDDIWEECKLEDLGIPCESGSNGCITLLTSRNMGLLDQMGAKVYAMKTLCEDEAWTLFTETTGTCVYNPDLASTPRDIVKECKGLPLAIVTIGKSLKDKPKETWKDALPQLKRSRPDNLSEFLEDVYMPLKVSYDLLKNEAAKSLFLLCCLFPEDFLISLEELTLYSSGLGMFELYCLEDTRNSVFTLVTELKNRSLLLDCEARDTVKMHDVIRDVAIFIATEEGKIDLKLLSKVRCDSCCKWISMFTSSTYESFDYLRGCNFPRLGLLCLQHTVEYTTWNIDDLKFLELMQNLTVLSLRDISFKSWSPPQSIKSLRKLRTLRLVGCNLESISLVGELLNLEILICSMCREIKKLPDEIRRLKSLKLLDISWCCKLKTIKPGIISELSNLEELKMVGSFDGWESTKVNEEQNINASIKEIEKLHKLICLEIQIKDMMLAYEEILLPESIVKYKVHIGRVLYQSDEDGRVVELKGVSGDNKFGSWIHKLAWTTEALVVDGHGLTRIELLEVYKTFQTQVQYDKLKHLKIKGYSNIKMLFSSSMVENLVNLRQLEIEDCEEIEEIIVGNEEEEVEIDVDKMRKDDVVFPKLKVLLLKKLPSLKALGKHIQSIEFPLLEVLFIEDCPNLRRSINGSIVENICEEEDDESLHLFCQKVKFNELSELHIVGHDNVSKIWCQHTPININIFKTLTKLVICECRKMQSLFSYCIAENKTTHLIKFPKLDRISLYKLPNLTSLFNGIEIMEFPMLTSLAFYECENLTTIVSPYQTHPDDANNVSRPLLCDEKVKFPRLKTLYIVGCHGVGSLFSSPTEENYNLVNLNWVYIETCDKMEQLVIAMEANKSHPITFPKLDTLTLENMPNLTSLGKGIEIMEFPMLTSLRLYTCPNLTTIVSPQQNWEDGQHINNANNDSLQSLFDEKVKICQLKKFNMRKCNNKSLFSSSMVESLKNLKEIDIRDCNNMERVIADEHVIHENYVLFPRLVRLNLESLPLLKMLCEWRCALQLLSLKRIDVNNCPSMEFLTHGLVKAPKLEAFNIDREPFSNEEELHGMEDLNGFLHQHIMSTRKISSMSSIRLWIVKKIFR